MFVSESFLTWMLYFFALYLLKGIFNFSFFYYSFLTSADQSLKYMNPQKDKSFDIS